MIHRYFSASMMNTDDKDPHQYCSSGFSPDDIVISGMSGRFPLCENIGQLHEALLTGKNMLEQNNDRYEKGNIRYFPLFSLPLLVEYDLI